MEAIGHFLENSDGTLYLYGSRTRDDLKGGDIDLLLIVNSQIANKLSEEKYKILTRIKKNIGEQKVDLIIATTEELKNDPFLQTLSESLVLLHQY